MVHLKMKGNLPRHQTLGDDGKRSVVRETLRDPLSAKGGSKREKLGSRG